MTRPLIAIAIAIATTAAAACVSLSRAAAELPDMPRDGEPARVFAPGVISTGNVFASTFTPGGRTVVFTRFAPPRPMTLMTSTFDGTRWSEPLSLPFSGTYPDLDPAYSPDGRRLYFSSLRPASGSPADTASGADTWYVDRTASGWSEPVRLPEPINGPTTDMYPSVTTAGTLFFDSRRSTPPQRAVYRAERRSDGSLGTPRRLDYAINADSGASNLFVDPDEKYVIFGATRPGGEGASDLFISWRTSSGWTPAQNLGALVNTAAVEFCPFVSRDGNFLFFTRVTTFADQRVERNIHVVRFDRLRERLRTAAK